MNNLLIKQLNKKDITSFIMKILNGISIAIVISVIPSAIISTLFKYIYLTQKIEIFGSILSYIKLFQFFMPIIAGFNVGLQFNLSGLQCSCIGGATFLASGAIIKEQLYQTTINGTIFKLTNIGDIFNIILIATISVIIIKLIGNKLGLLNVIFLPIIIGIGVGYIGTITLTYISQVTIFIGKIISSLTTMSPIIATTLIAIIFSLLIITPISTIALGIAIGLSGIGSAAAGMGVASSAMYLIIATAHANKPSIPITIGIGGIKIMVPNFIQNPIIGLPISISAAISSIPITFINLTGTPESAGFGLIGMISPLASMNGSNIGIIQMIIFWIIIPFITAFIIEIICRKIIKLYDKNIFKLKLNY